MRVPWSVGLGVAMLVVVAACGGGPGATQGPAGATVDPGSGPTSAPQATVDPGPGGGPILPGNGSGKVNYQISGPVERSGELPFFGVGSRFSGPAGQYFSFTKTDGDAAEIFTIFPAINTEGEWLVGYTAEDVQISATACSISNWQTSDTAASGTFDCQNAIVMSGEGQMQMNGRIQGSFEARS